MIDFQKKPLSTLLIKKRDGGVGETRVIIYPDKGSPLKATLIGRNEKNMLLRVPGQKNIVAMPPDIKAILAH